MLPIISISDCSVTLSLLGDVMIKLCTACDGEMVIEGVVGFVGGILFSARDF